jgi:hypothetical protein
LFTVSPLAQIRVRADDHRFHLAAGHLERPGAVPRDPVVDARVAQFPGGQPGALQQRPRLRGDHVPEQPAPMQFEHHAEGGPADHRGQRAGVAVGEHPRPVPAQLGDQVGAAPGHRLGGRDLLVADQAGLGEHGVETRGQQRRGASRLAGQIHRRRARALNSSYGLAELIVVRGEQPGGQRDAERTGDPECGCAADRQPPDRRDQVLDRGEPQHPQFARQRRLIDDLDRPVHPVDRPHASYSSSHG